VIVQIGIDTPIFEQCRFFYFSKYVRDICSVFLQAQTVLECLLVQPSQKQKYTAPGFSVTHCKK